jgi:uncharacterized membrane protein YjjP (DUF1212 family)
VSKIINNNFTDKEKDDIRFFYFESGINYEKIGKADKVIMNIYNKTLKVKNNRSEVENGTKKAIAESYDHTRKEDIKPLVNHIIELSGEGV